MSFLAVKTAAATVLAALAAHAPPHYPVPPWFYPQALCVHSGWLYKQAHTRDEYRRADYRFGPHLAFLHTVDIYGSGEGSWDDVNGSYGGGMQFMLGTYNRAAALSHGRLPYAGSHSDIARLSAAAQIYAAYLIVRQDHGSWGEWPLTSRACGLR